MWGVVYLLTLFGSVYFVHFSCSEWIVLIECTDTVTEYTDITYRNAISVH